MSHHINFDISTKDQKQLSPKGNKTETKSAKKRETKKLEIDNKQMEWRLHQLKLAMEKEKEEREQKSYIWQSGKDGALESHARNVLGRTIKSKSAVQTDLKKTKVKVLSDEPLDIPKRNCHSKNLIDKLKMPMPPKKPSSIKSPVEVVNKECWISIGFDRYSVDVMEIQSDRQGNLPLETLQGLNPVAIGLYYMRYGRKRLLLAVDNRVVQPKTGWGNDVYYPYVANVSLSPQKSVAEPTPPLSSRLPTDRPKEPETVEKTHFAADESSHLTMQSENPEPKSEQGHLLNGIFDEKANALAFQEAVSAWRSGNQPKTTKKLLNEKDNLYVEMAVHDVQSDPIKPPEITFSETSSLTFMEKLLLKKHRKTDIPPLPDSHAHFSANLSAVEPVLTEEELEEKERYRELFSPQPSQLSSFPTHERSEVVVSEIKNNDVLDLDGSDLQPTTYCYVDEASDSDEIAPTASKLETSAVKIQEATVDVVVQDNASDKRGDLRAENITLNGLTTSPVSSVAQNVTTKTIKAGMKAHTNRASSFISACRNGSGVIVQAIGSVPMNPDAMYKTNLNEYYSNMEQERHKLYQSLNQNPRNLLMCKQYDSNWSMPQESTESEQHDYAKDSNENAVTVQAANEIVEREQDDVEALEKLEWELASQTGNITNDGRLSRLIDDWSSDEDDKELEIKDDPGFGSGLSTPDPEPITLVGTSLSWREDNQMLQEFQMMEDLMLVNDNSNSDSRCSDS